MSEYRLLSPGEAIRPLASMIASIKGNRCLRFSVREDVCFPDEQFLDLGQITMKPGAFTTPSETESETLRNAVGFGFYEWAVPDHETVMNETVRLLDDASRPNQRDKAQEALRSVAAAATRIGLLHPTFDVDVLAKMPFTRSTTVITDSSSVIQGGLDFVARFLYPMARLKVPAIVHMEILNYSDNYFKLRRMAGDRIKKGEALLAHVISQGGQRVLLRLELQSDAEVERTGIFADPLRNAFQVDKSSDARDLSLNAPIRGYCDRLILETVRQHQSHSIPGHLIALMTSDQGFARMALAEGIQVIHHQVPKPNDIFGTTRTGTCFHPFSGELYSVSLVTLLWEFAVTFGSAKLTSLDNKMVFQACAIGENLTWQPFHSQEDLLWVKTDGIIAASEPTEPVEAPCPTKGEPTSSDVRISRVKQTTPALTGSYKFSPDSMLRLVELLSQRGTVSETEASQAIGVSASRPFADYRNFLLAGRFVELDGDSLKKTSVLSDLSSAIRTIDFERIAGCLLRVSSFRDFITYLASNRPAKPDEKMPVSRRAVSTYLTLAEIATLAIQIPSQGICATDHKPSSRDFADIAVVCYDHLRRGEPYVPVGAWLERLASKHAIHPIVARECLEQSRVDGHVERFTEGATPDTRFERHSFRSLRKTTDSTEIVTIHLYHGDFLIPGKASVSLRVERRNR